jgi:hypothetical protein
MSELLLLDRAGRRRSPATMPGFHTGGPSRNKGFRCPADPPKIEKIIAVMRTAGDDARGRRPRGLIVVPGAPGCVSRKRWRSPKATSITGAARCSCVGARADVAAKSAWTRGAGTSSSHGSSYESSFPSALCSVSSTAGRVVARGRVPAPETELRRTAVSAGVRRRFAPHQLRHAHAVEMAHEGVPLVVIQRQLGHSNPASPRPTSKASTTPRSSTRSTPAVRP